MTSTSACTSARPGRQPSNTLSATALTTARRSSAVSPSSRSERPSIHANPASARIATMLSANSLSAPARTSAHRDGELQPRRAVTDDCRRLGAYLTRTAIVAHRLHLLRWTEVIGVYAFAEPLATTQRRKEGPEALVQHRTPAERQSRATEAEIPCATEVSRLRSFDTGTRRRSAPAHPNRHSALGYFML